LLGAGRQRAQTSDELRLLDLLSLDGIGKGDDLGVAGRRGWASGWGSVWVGNKKKKELETEGKKFGVGGYFGMNYRNM
jgi:hypothetical protein